MNRFAVGIGSLVMFVVAANCQSNQTVANSDVYHVHFTKAALGQTKALETELKTQNAKAPMPGHYLVLRHQQGDDWDYVVIEHLGNKVSVDPAAYTPPASGAPANSSWHTDTFVAGPNWDVFAKAMGVGADAGKTAASVYVVATWRTAPGHRQDLEKTLTAQDPNSKVPIGHVVVAHLEGGPWTFLTLDRYNSWQDYATDEAATQDSPMWYDVRNHGAWHHDTVTTRVATAAAAAVATPK
jgi:hypothetical protein